MKNDSFLLLLLFLLAACSLKAQSVIQKKTNNMQTVFEKNNNTTATYQEAIQFYKALDKKYSQLQVSEFGMTDAGKPLHVAVLSTDEDFDPKSIRKKGKVILMINNAIHAGEPCGVDASMMLLRDYLESAERQKLLANVVLVVIPMYNIGGVLNRNSHTRTNQNGPESYGFRGNAKNLDLNRDFIKCDSKNAKSFNQIFNQWQPDVFIDNHTSNGADYQYSITLIATQHNKLDPNLAAFMQEQMLPELYKKMKTRDWEMTPYVFARNTPDDGIAAFLDLPRYSSGYAALHHTISFMPETHMLKPFKNRVQSTYAFMDEMILFLHNNANTLKATRDKAIAYTKFKPSFDLNWTLDMDHVEQLLFKGYEAKYKKSKVTGQERLYYDRAAPYEKEIPFFNNYKSILKIEKPAAYIIPQAYSKVVERLKWNGVQLNLLDKDQALEVELYRIVNFKSTDEPYEGHYLHREVEVEKMIKKVKYRKGDFVVFTNQASNRYLIEALEPQAPDSYFVWNFFDGILMQKEYFSAYVFEDLAAEILQQNPDLKKQFEAKKKEDQTFAQSANAQLNFIYHHSQHYEPTHRVYPVGRVLHASDLKTF